MDISTAYKQHQHIRLMQEDIAETQQEVKFTETAYKLAFVATFLVYFIFVWMMYVSDLWGFTTWLVQNLSEVAALVVYSVLALTLPLAMAMIKEIGYKHFAKYPNPTSVIVLIVGILALAGVVYESISSSSQQQHISTSAAEGSKTFQALTNTQITVMGSSGSEVAAASQKLARCEENLKRGREKHCEGDRARLNALKAAQADNAANQAAASVAALEAKTKAMQDLKEDAYKPVFKSIRDSFGVSISTGVMIVTLFVSVIFEISHLLLILFLGQKLKRLEGLKHALVQYQADYLKSTGKAFDAGDFAEFESGAIPKPEPQANRQDYKQTKPDFGFIPQTAQLDGYGGAVGNGGMVAPAPLFKYQQAGQQEAKANGLGFVGFVDPNRQPKREGKQDDRPFYGFTDPAKQAVLDALNLADGSEDRKTLDARTANQTYRQELRGGSKQFRDMSLDKPAPALPANQKNGGTGLQNPALGTAEEHYSLPLEASPKVPEGRQDSHPSRPSAEGIQTLQPKGTEESAIPKVPEGQEAEKATLTDGLYERWVSAIRAGQCAASVKQSWGWVQKQIAGNQAEKLTFNNREITAVVQLFFARAIRDGYARLNPKYTSPKCGLPKYQWIA
ncbi:hypothetical protein [Thiothrix nivea]|uniref:Uncharacterized protein n=1 Tax=Thiothrix nivea (strain ATCC 35100 / DSM 5205 / JP2) TaxID=870187 RepID=A0A656HDS3_THINJ|nr:hypothetical protein [Thiothrix nivea]EIJ34513.1 hypothetical protein Thini_1937 [Thiothrix nivea DSM 5205]